MLGDFDWHVSAMKKTIVQVEFSQSTLELREDILCELGHPFCLCWEITLRELRD